MKAGQRKILSFDIGGTSCRMALFAMSEEGDLALLDKRTVSSSLVHNDEDLGAACKKEFASTTFDSLWGIGLAVAGPVDQGRAKLVNADMLLSRQGLAKAFSCKSVALANDFAGTSMSLACKPGKEARLIRGVSKKSRTGLVCGVIGPGTGLGCGMLFFDRNGRPTPLASEGGHMPYGFATEEELALQSFLQKRLSKELLSLEDVVSGRGLEAVHAFKTGQELSAREIGELLALGEALPTRDLFGYALGKACGTWALASLCYGGLWIAGGVAMKNPVLVDCSAFRDGLVQGRHRDFLEALPIFLLEDLDCGLWGAAALAVREYL